MDKHLKFVSFALKLIQKTVIDTVIDYDNSI